MSDVTGDGRRILIVEDDSTVAELLVEVLRHEGFTSTVAADGLEGLVRLRGDQPDLAVLDIMMPDINGVRVLEQLLEEGDGALEVPVIVITGSPEGANQSRRLLGDDNVFEKPFDPDDLVARIRAVLG
jgi:DNA-binding response OmpR family regulator